MRIERAAKNQNKYARAAWNYGSFVIERAFD